MDGSLRRLYEQVDPYPVLKAPYHTHDQIFIFHAVVQWSSIFSPLFTIQFFFFPAKTDALFYPPNVWN